MPDETTKPVARCGAPVSYAGNEYVCSLHLGHPGPHHTWVEDVDDEQEREQYGDRERADEERERLGW